MFGIPNFYVTLMLCDKYLYMYGSYKDNIYDNSYQTHTHTHLYLFYKIYSRLENVHHRELPYTIGNIQPLTPLNLAQQHQYIYKGEYVC